MAFECALVWYIGALSHQICGINMFSAAAATCAILSKAVPIRHDKAWGRRQAMLFRCVSRLVSGLGGYYTRVDRYIFQKYWLRLLLRLATDPSLYDSRRDFPI